MLICKYLTSVTNKDTFELSDDGDNSMTSSMSICQR